MQNPLDLLLDLLNLEDEERHSFLAIGEVISHHLNKKLIIHHRMGFIFQSRYDLLLEKLPLDAFLAVGDISSSQPLRKPDTLSSLDLLQSPKKLTELPEESLLLVDEISFLALSTTEQQAVQDILEQRKVLLLVC
ncbi:MAG: hypothetical protein LBO09_03745 [Candidatus Peribacteria bacterium]|jgi:hypothetical protein|nr:hypothetical protein [Candidatus Peribacteria bacterium]